jgi:putative endonuclease
MFYTYILRSEKDSSYYVGQTNNLQSRLKYHNSGKVNYTKRGIPWKLVYFEEYQTRSEAALRERYIKNRKSKKYIETIINKM